MAFEIHPDESARHGLRRLARKELRSARELITRARAPSEDSIHAARRSLKKVRAIVALIDEDKGRGLDSAMRRLRDVNHTLSGLRDADAMIATLAAVKSRNPDLFSKPGYARIRRRLLRRSNEVSAAAARQAGWKDIARQLRAVQRSARRWRPNHGGFRALAHGIRATVNRARRARARARRTGAADDFHAWRKEIKALWYALRLVGSGTPAVGHDIRALRSAERWLGDEHNLVVLCGTLARDPTVCRGPVDVQRLQRAVDAMQVDLRRKALRRTHALFAVRPRDYASRVERAWRMRRRARARGRPAAPPRSDTAKRPSNGR
jgi:CHAD domain-containing protein